MSNEFKVLKTFCNSREDFDKTSSHFEGIKNLEKEVKFIYNLIKTFYSKYNTATSISLDDIKTFYDACMPASKDKLMFYALFDEIFSMNINDDLLKDLTEQIIERHVSAQIIDKLVPVVEGQRFNILPEIQEDIDNYLSKLRNPIQSANQLTPINYTLQELVDMEINFTGIPWFLPKLNATIGGGKRKTLGLIYAFVDVGKTSFGCRACAGFAKELKDTQEIIVYAGNEESGSRVSLRIDQALLGKTKSEIAADVKTAEAELKALGRDRIQLFDSVTNIKQIEKLLDTIHPAILFIDQGTKITIAGGNEEDVERTQKLFNRYRELAKSYDAQIISLAQAVGDAENRKYLKLSDIYGSRVAIQGELDYSIGIGRELDNAATQDHRFISTSKNKLLDGESIRFITQFDRQRCDFKEI